MTRYRIIVHITPLETIYGGTIHDTAGQNNKLKGKYYFSRGYTGIRRMKTIFKLRG